MTPQVNWRCYFILRVFPFVLYFSSHFSPLEGRTISCRINPHILLHDWHHFKSPALILLVFLSIFLLLIFLWILPFSAYLFSEQYFNLSSSLWLLCLSFSISFPSPSPCYIFTGTCQCHGTIPLAQICDASCRASAPSMSCSNSTTGTGDILVKTNGVVRTIPASSFTSAGVLSCAPVPGGSSAIYSMSTLSGRLDP